MIINVINPINDYNFCKNQISLILNPIQIFIMGGKDINNKPCENSC